MATGSRRRGKGSITSYSVKAGTRWRWQLWVPNDPEDPESGLRQTGKGGYLTSAAADAGLDEAKAKLKGRVTFARTMPTVANYLDDWIDGRQLERSTIAGYKRLSRNHIRGYPIGDMPLDRLTATHLARHYRQLQQNGRKDSKGEGTGLSANTVGKVGTVLSTALDAAVSDGLIVANPARKRDVVQAPTGRQIKAQKPEMHVWDAAQLSAFLRWNLDPYNDPMHALWVVAANTGARRSEVLALKWRDVDFVRCRITIRRALDTELRGATKTPKSGAGRVIDVDDGTLAVLRGWKADLGSAALDLIRPEGFVFGNPRTGEPRSPNEVSRRWRTRVRLAREALGENALQPIRLHDLRHVHASILLSVGTPVNVVSERLGHANPTITLSVYAHVLQGQGRAAADAFAAALTGSR
ncbi:site-specific integrase [Rhodococcus globerulus]|uniref:site-specific integrase n=1 Tax=Rhodococcus globerulus TaxID=33008 RepID=UPI003017BAFE